MISKFASSQIAFLACICIAPVVARAQTDTKVETKAPPPVACGSNFLPPELQTGFVEGTVVLSLIVGLDGLPHDIKIQKSSGNVALDHASLACAATFRYSPALLNGKPIEIKATPSIVWKKAASTP